MSLPVAGTAQADEAVGTGGLTVTDHSAAAPAMRVMDPVTGAVSGVLAEGVDGVLSTKTGQVAYIRYRDECVQETEGCVRIPDLVTAAVDGTNQRVLVESVQDEGGDYYIGRPDWSPNGKRVLYDTPRGLEWIGADGSGSEILASGRAGTFSPDGSSIAFMATTQYESWDGWEYSQDVHVMDLATRQVRPLTRQQHATEAPDWSPDGQRIVYVAEYGVRVVEVATGTVTEIPTPGLSNFRTPVFSPDGSAIAFHALDDSTGTGAVYVVDADGANLHVLTDRAVTLTDWISK
ncbi:DPP IV N-terminal domain-containing protein [Streptomyces ficellus]|uniref:DPP IV N-terminal domain-containing protein n=1 Tax=Streptomyces ficellus TaxID=1977088 RepID=A0ABT7Z923_9ACTN|nr:DPP IV N-terminal domain-containing protein [Streptomyces ficellus]MDN3295928.1 DPP IV N-terminal domain-containing protein [Streptomyces ficellus]